MRKIKGAISLLVLFVFLVISILLMYLLLSIERRVSINQNTFDAVESSYISESIAKIVFREKLEKATFRKLFIRDQIRIENVDFLNTSASNIYLAKKRKKNNEFSQFQLFVEANYKGISSNTIGIGSLVNEAFYQGDGRLSRSEMDKANLSPSLMEELSSPFYEGNNFIKDNIYILRDDARATFENPRMIFTPLEITNPPENGFTETKESAIEDISDLGEEIHKEEPILFELKTILPNIIDIHSNLQIEDSGKLSGIVIVRNGALVNIEKNLFIDGVCILEEGARIVGNLSISGLLINANLEEEPISTVFNAEFTERYLYTLDAFLNPRIDYYKKIL